MCVHYSEEHLCVFDEHRGIIVLHWTVIGITVLYRSYHTFAFMNQMENLGLQLSWALWWRPSLTKKAELTKQNSFGLFVTVYFSTDSSLGILLFPSAFSGHSSPHFLQINEFSLLHVLNRGMKYCSAVKGEPKNSTQTKFMWVLYLFDEKWKKKKEYTKLFDFFKSSH